MKYTLFSLALGLLLGYFSHPLTVEIAHTIVELFLNLLKFLALPIIFFSIVSTISSLTNLQEAGKILRRVIAYTLLTTLIAASIGLLLFQLFQPHIIIEGSPPVPSIDAIHYVDFLKKIVPDNLVTALLEGNVLGIAFIASLFSIAILKLPAEQGAPLKSLFNSLFAALLKISSGLIKGLPVAIFGFAVEFMQGLKTNSSGLGTYALVVIGANLVQGLLVLPLLLKQKGIAPFPFFRTMLPALSMAFFSKSSNATLPLTLECASKAGISNNTARLSLPLCSVINMNGCAAFILITVLFALNSHGITPSLWQMIGWIFLATLAAIGNAGVPMGCYFLTSAFLLSMHIPLDIMGLILPLYAFFDMVETALNVWSDASVTVIADKKRHPTPLPPSQELSM